MPTLVHHPRHPRWHVTQARRLRNLRQYVTHAGMSLTLARHQRKPTTSASKPSTQARHPWHLR